MSQQAASRVAARRGVGEDAAAVIDAGGGLVLVVADGAGGTGGGAEAARAVVELVRTVSGQLVDGRLGAATVLMQADLDLARSRAAGQTTAVVAVVSAAGVRGASVGDSEAWWFGDGDAVQLTEMQQRKPLLGTAQAFAVPFGIERAKGTLLLGSDGLFKYARRDRIAGVARMGTAEETAARLLDLARLPGGGLQDDAAVVVCRLD